MAVTEVRVALQPHEPLWELPLQKLQGAAVAVIGWVQTDSPIDSGVPGTVARALAHSLTSQYNVTYPSSSGPLSPWERAGVRASRSGIDTWRPNPEGWDRRLRSGITLLRTHQPDAVLRLFQTHHFNWSLKTQVVMLSAITAPPPPLAEAQLIQLLERSFDWRRLAKDAAIQGLLQPGVDGDFAGLSLFDGGLEDTLSLLRAECGRAEIGFRIVTEAEFRATTWILERSV